MKFSKILTFGLLVLSFTACKKESSNNNTPTDPNANANKAWTITQNNLTVDGQLFVVHDTDVAVYNNFSGSLNVGEGQYFFDQNKKSRFSLWNLDNNILFEKGMILGGNDFEGQDVWEFQYDPIDGNGDWTAGLQASNIKKENQGTIMISDMKSSTTTGHGISMIEFKFDDLLVADTYTSQGTGTQGTNTQGTATISTFNGLIRIEFK